MPQLLIGFNLSALVLSMAAATLAHAAPIGAPQREPGPAPGFMSPCGGHVVTPRSPCLELRTYAIDLSRKAAGSPVALVRTEMEILRKNGATVVGLWQQLGQPPAFVYLLSFRDGAHRDGVLAALEADPEWKQLQKDNAIPKPTSVIFMTALAPQVLFGDQIVPIGGSVSEPRLLSQTEAEYTPEARDARISGVVEMLIAVKPDGTVEFRDFNKTLGFGLDQKAADAVRKWKFQPAMKDGQPVSSLMMVQVQFSLR
jgi:TonB family protein